MAVAEGQPLDQPIPRHHPLVAVALNPDHLPAVLPRLRGYLPFEGAVHDVGGPVGSQHA